MNMAEVSVVIPVYNVEKYLSFCLDSVINQTFEDIEIICVNDGSTDKSAFILGRYADFDNRIKIITRENGGLSAARNTGLDAVQGDYVLFVDSDDYVSPLLVENTLELSKKFGADYVSFNNFVLTQNPKKIYLSFCAVDNSLENKFLQEKNLPPSMLADIPLTAWSKLYKTKLIKDNNMKFIEGMQYEDGPWGYEYFCVSRSFVFSNQSLYFYRAAREGSIMLKKDLSVLDVLKSLKLSDEVMKKYGKFDKYKSGILKLNLDLLMFHYNRLTPDIRKIYYKEAKDYITSFVSNGVFELKEAKHRNYLNLFLNCGYEEFEKAVAHA